MIIRHNKLIYGGVDCDVHDSQWQRRSDPLSSLIVRGRVKRIFLRNEFQTELSVTFRLLLLLLLFFLFLFFYYNSGLIL